MSMKKKQYYVLAAVLFAIIAVAHALRAVYQWEAVIAGVTIPLWFSWVAVGIAGYLAIRGFQLAKKTR
jgi:uncharacterized membrane protein YozB (DUF420 family)